MTTEQLATLNKFLTDAKESGDQRRIDEAMQEFDKAIAHCQMKMADRVKKIEKFVDSNDGIGPAIDELTKSIGSLQSDKDKAASFLSGAKLAGLAAFTIAGTIGGALVEIIRALIAK